MPQRRPLPCRCVAAPSAWPWKKGRAGLPAAGPVQQLCADGLPHLLPCLLPPPAICKFTPMDLSRSAAAGARSVPSMSLRVMTDFICICDHSLTFGHNCLSASFYVKRVCYQDVIALTATAILTFNFPPYVGSVMIIPCKSYMRTWP